MDEEGAGAAAAGAGAGSSQIRATAASAPAEAMRAYCDFMWNGEPLIALLLRGCCLCSLLSWWSLIDQRVYVRFLGDTTVVVVGETATLRDVVEGWCSRKGLTAADLLACGLRVFGGALGRALKLTTSTDCLLEVCPRMCLQSGAGGCKRAHTKYVQRPSCYGGPPAARTLTSRFSWTRMHGALEAGR
jgi:hypothetical protein